MGTTNNPLNGGHYFCVTCNQPTQLDLTVGGYCCHVCKRLGPEWRSTAAPAPRLKPSPPLSPPRPVVAARTDLRPPADRRRSSAERASSAFDAMRSVVDAAAEWPYTALK